TDLAFENGYPGPLSKVLGVWVEEIDALYPDQTNVIVMADGSGSYPCRHIADLLHAEGAQVLATYGSDFYAGMPVLTRNTVGQGEAYYLGSDPDAAFLDRFYAELLAAHGLASAIAAPAGVEVAQRVKNGQPLTFVLNHNATAVTLDLGAQTYTDRLTGATLSGAITLAPYAVHLLV
ncbi:MAG: beta-galactosidase trimerization domain-containing protein, partial [Anaerolineae bacterium]|nr:beta-galactosidase trimerization domain-containing protein [Anaerolineae bacterium]